MARIAPERSEVPSICYTLVSATTNHLEDIAMLPGRFAGAVALCTVSAFAAADQLVIDITGVEQAGGHMMVTVYDDAESWEASEGAVAAARDSVTGDTVRVIFANLSSGRHAVMLYHDQNDNGELDANMLGIPSESYGFSNDAGRLGRPAFDEAAFDVDGDTTIEITLR